MVIGMSQSICMPDFAHLTITHAFSLLTDDTARVIFSE
jgi:hypothetical protein